MAASLLDSDTFGFADGNSGHVCDLGSGPAAGDLDVLCVNSNTVVTTPSGFTVGEQRVNNQGSYVYYRLAVGGEASTVTVTTSGNHNTQVTWSRWDHVEAVDAGGHGDVGAETAAANLTPQLTTGALAETGELVVAFGALHSIGDAAQTSPVWTAAYTPLTTAAQGTGAAGVRGYVAYRVDGGTSAEVVDLSWSGTGAANRYLLAVAFTGAEVLVTGTVDVVLPAVTAALDAAVTVRGTLDATLPAVQATAGMTVVTTVIDGQAHGPLPDVVGAVTARTVGIVGAVT